MKSDKDPTKGYGNPLGNSPRGQLGREGKTLEMVKYPDHEIDLIPEFGNNGGSSLEASGLGDLKNHQVVDIPMPYATFTECSLCQNPTSLIFCSPCLLGSSEETY